MADQSYLQGGFSTGGDATFLADLTAADRLLYNNAYVLTTADDTTTTLTINSYPDVLCVGSGILQWIDLGDATTYAVGQQFRITNASTEIVGVKNSDNSTWYRLPPRWELAAVCTSVGSAAGSWFVSVRPGITAQDGLFLLDDFMGGTAADCEMGWLTAVSGAGSSASTTPVFSYVGQQCHIWLATGSTTTGYAQIYTRSSLLTTNCVNSFSAHLASGLSSATDEFIIRMGFGDSTDMSDHTDGMYFEYDRLTNGHVWSINTAAAGVRTETVTAVAPVVASSGGSHFLVESASDASRVDYWIDRVHVGTITTTIPGASDSFGVHMGIVKSAGTTNKVTISDYISLGRYPTTER